LGWFERAQELNKNDKYLYIAWAEFYEKVGDYRNAQNKVNYILS
jgi:hypothetical protein